MSNIQDYLAQILAARYGRDVRQSIHDAIETCYNDGRAGAIDLQAREDISALQSGKQDKNDNSLDTVDKTVVGAINEVNSGKVTDLGGISVPSTETTYESCFTNAFSQIKNVVKYEHSYSMGIYWSGHAGFTCEFTVILNDILIFDITGVTTKYIGSFVISSNSIILNEVQKKAILKSGVVSCTYASSTKLSAQAIDVSSLGFTSNNDYVVVLTLRGDTAYSGAATGTSVTSKTTTSFTINALGTGFSSNAAQSVDYAVIKAN